MCSHNVPHQQQTVQVTGFQSLAENMIQLVLAGQTLVSHKKISAWEYDLSFHETLSLFWLHGGCNMAHRNTIAS